VRSGVKVRDGTPRTRRTLCPGGKTAKRTELGAPLLKTMFCGSGSFGGGRFELHADRRGNVKKWTPSRGWDNGRSRGRGRSREREQVLAVVGTAPGTGGCPLPSRMCIHALQGPNRVDADRRPVADGASIGLPTTRPFDCRPLSAARHDASAEACHHRAFLHDHVPEYELRLGFRLHFGNRNHHEHVRHLRPEWNESVDEPSGAEHPAGPDQFAQLQAIRVGSGRSPQDRQPPTAGTGASDGRREFFQAHPLLENERSLLVTILPWEQAASYRETLDRVGFEAESVLAEKATGRPTGRWYGTLQVRKVGSHGCQPALLVSSARKPCRSGG
jgi:hypothetical protein